MQLSEKQARGLDIAIKRWRDGEKYTVISGYAGSGKTTLIKYITEALYQEGLSEEDIVYCSFTGKACRVLQEQGNKNVSTLHKLLYESVPLVSGGFFRKPLAAIPYSVVIVDEISMVSKELVDLLFSHRVHIICCGDSMQLPPIKEEENNHLLDHPHIFLDEIHRQAQDNEIIRLSMDIREGKPIAPMEGKDVIILPRKELTRGMLHWADQVLVAKNDTRQKINDTMRLDLGREGAPQDGDKIIILRNYWETFSDQSNALVNGTIGTLQNSFSSFIKYPKYLVEKQKITTTLGNLVIDEAEAYNNLILDTNMILTGNYSLTWKENFKIGKNKNYSGTQPLEATYAYAITCHKAQGSQWDKVLVIEENFPFDKEMHKRWLYTSVTRATSRLVLIH